MKTTPLNVAAAILLCASLAMAQAVKPVTLKVGDAPPPLAGGKWVQGQPVRAFEKGKIYVIEMWATWCGPCVAAIPHINQMQADYAKDGLIIIGQNIWENSPSEVEPFLRKMGPQMTYRVVMDNMTGGGRGKMAETWMDAAGRNGIPSSFIIGKDGKLAWIGHPMAMEPVIKQIIAGTFDPRKAAAELAATEQMQRDLQGAMARKEWNHALTVIDNFYKAQPTASRDQPDRIRFFILLQKGDYAAAYTLGAELAVRFNDDAQALNELAWTIVDEPGLQRRDLDLAEKMAVRAVDLSKRNDANILDTLARVHFEKGRIDQAIAIQTEAMNKASGDQKSMFQETLNKYRVARRPPR